MVSFANEEKKGAEEDEEGESLNGRAGATKKNGTSEKKEASSLNATGDVGTYIEREIRHTHMYFYIHS